MLSDDISEHVGDELELLAAYESLDARYHSLGHSVTKLYAAIDRIIDDSKRARGGYLKPAAGEQ